MWDEGRWSEWPEMTGKSSEWSIVILGMDGWRVIARSYWGEVERGLRGWSMEMRRIGRGMMIVLLRHWSGLVKVGCDLDRRHLGSSPPDTIRQSCLDHYTRLLTSRRIDWSIKVDQDTRGKGGQRQCVYFNGRG
jgi:hypothetical protein